MQAITVVKVPSGEAPEHIRKAWTNPNVILPLSELLQTEDPIAVSDVVSGKIQEQPIAVYLINTRDAILALYVAGETEAGQWWDTYPLKRYLLCFHREDCEVITGNVTFAYETITGVFEKWRQAPTKK